MSTQFLIASLPQLLPYALLLLAYALISLESELLDDKTFALPILILLSAFVGLRGTMTPDMQRYMWMYQDSRTLGFVSTEPSFIFISAILHALSLDYHALFFSYTIITLALVYLGIRNQSPHVKLALLLYVLLPGYFLNLFVEMRELCAVAFTFYAISVLRRKGIRLRVPIFIVLMSLSVAFHYSAIFFWAIVLPGYKFIRRPHSSFVYLISIVGSLLVPTSFLIIAINAVAMPILPARYHGYIEMFLQLETGLTESGQMLKTIIYGTMAVCFVYWWRPKKAEGDHTPLNLFVIGVIVLGLTRSFAAASRLSYFFVIYQIILVPDVLERVKEKIARMITAYGTLVFYLAQFAWGLFYYSTEAGTYPYLHYQNILLSVFK